MPSIENPVPPEHRTEHVRQPESGSVPKVSVVVPTHNPHPGRLAATLGGLRGQTLPAVQWEVLMVDNASVPAVEIGKGADAPAGLRIVREPQLGLTHARLRGFSASQGEVVVLVDDDNVLAPDYLSTVVRLFAENPRVGVLGGRSQPEFAVVPPAWTREFHALLALRDLGPEPRISAGLRPPGSAINVYPEFAPIGAGMALRRSAFAAWAGARAGGGPGPSDRRGADLASAGDNDIVLCAMRAGWEVGYFPELSLTHLIPAARLEAAYLARLNRGIQNSWMQVLTLHGANPWPPLTATGALLRKAKAWGATRAWTSACARVRWQGACGHFDGRVPQ